MDPLVIGIYLLVLFLAWADGLFWRSALRSWRGGERTAYTFSLIAGLSISIVCLLVSFTAVVLNGTAEVRLGPRGMLGAANLVLCAILILGTAFRFNSQLIRQIFGTSLFLMFLWFWLATAH
jgi:hypothetical protein